MTISGKVVIAGTGTPLAGSSVFISGSSKGTSTDGEGVFMLNNVPGGSHELIISNIGYETKVISYTPSQLPLQLTVEMQVKAKELENVTIESAPEEGWDRWGKVFFFYFVGNSKNAEQCKILNEQAIKFRYFKNSKRLIAYCDGPVMLENKALGYVVSYQLEGFEVNYGNASVTYYGYPLFIPMEIGNSHKWDKNREEAYTGSVMHFMRALFNNRLSEEGFHVRRLIQVPNYEKQRVARLYHEARANKSDSLKYYDRVIQQRDIVDIIGTTLLTSDSLLSAAGDDTRLLYFEDQLQIICQNEWEELGYRQMDALPFQSPRKAERTRSTARLLDNTPVTLYRDGSYVRPQDFTISAYWGFSSKMSNSLPVEYESSAFPR